jgi:hypothetical protein
MRKKLHTEKLVSLHQILLRHSTTEQEISGPVNKRAVQKYTQNFGRKVSRDKSVLKEDTRMRANLSGSGQSTRVGFCNSNSLVLSGSVKLITYSLQSNIRVSKLIILR